MISYDQVKTIIENDPCDKIKWAREYNDKLLLHVEGLGLDKYLERINSYENASQYEARQKHAISNKFITEELLRPVDNAFHARGGSKTYKFTSEANKESYINHLTDTRNGLSLSEYIEQIWFNKFVTDPNGLIFMEITNEEVYEGEEDEERETVIEPTYKNIHNIRSYEQNGIHVDWVVFEPHKKFALEESGKDVEVEQFWVVDEKFYYLYQNKDGKIREIERIENSFGMVPAILCSNIVDNVTGWKKSPIDAQIELLNKYLVSNSVLTIAEFFHNYPQQWRYVDECSYCEGTGVEEYNIRNSETGSKECSHCGGSRKATRKDVTDAIELRIPEGDQQKIAPDISGYIYMPTEPWTLMTDTVDRYWNIIYFSQWGTVVSKDTSNETATGRFLDAQPVNNRLNKYSRSMELAHTSIANFIGEFYYPETFEKAYIQYGRRYLIETPDQIWEKYLEAKKDNAPTSVLDLLLTQFVESEFRENEQAYAYEMKKINLEPFIHWNVLDVQTLNVASLDYKKKLYFNDWVKTKSVKEIVETDLTVLNTELDKYATDKDEPVNNNQNE